MEGKVGTGFVDDGKIVLVGSCFLEECVLEKATEVGDVGGGVMGEVEFMTLFPLEVYHVHVIEHGVVELFHIFICRFVHIYIRHPVSQSFIHAHMHILASEFFFK